MIFTNSQQGFVFTWEFPVRVARWQHEQRQKKKVFNCKWITSINSRKQLLFPLGPLEIIFSWRIPDTWTHSQGRTLWILSNIKNPKSEPTASHASCESMLTALTDLGESQCVPRIPRENPVRLHTQNLKTKEKLTSKLKQIDFYINVILVSQHNSVTWQWKSVRHCVFLI